MASRAFFLFYFCEGKGQPSGREKRKGKEGKKRKRTRKGTLEAVLETVETEGMKAR